ncbi:ornithine cyclodeaminase family protein [Streptomyces sp. V3I7]|uniref:ornithine cyclodeaminase family protein n=1 Tax=Streptomyces sp. V3I7 TaxID=3042278 RepID=UPI0027D83C54|nr:ornithine cyclodeaminase family protein [Streptomyces sp. V3I7]
MTEARPASSLPRIRSLAGAMRASLLDGAVARMRVPPRETVEGPAGGKFISMPAVSPDHDLYVNKVATIVSSPVPGHGSTVTAVVPMFSVSTGRFLGTLDGTAVTNLKCAAVTALVTDACAAPDSRVLAILGSGVQARQQFLGVSAVRDLAEIRVWSRTARNAEAFARDIAETARTVHGRPVRVVVCASPEEAGRGADVLSTATLSTDPLPLPEPLPEHVHINCMGAHTTASREVSGDLLRSSLVVVEDLGTAIAEAGGSHADAIELAALVTSEAAHLARRRTLFASTGCAYLDLITCAHLVNYPDSAGEFSETGPRPGSVTQAPVDGDITRQ